MIGDTDKLTITQIEEMCSGKWPSYKVSTTGTLRQLADTMRENERLRSVLIECESFFNADGEDQLSKMCAIALRNKDTDK